jgi:hypothetical protein
MRASVGETFRSSGRVGFDGSIVAAAFDAVTHPARARVLEARTGLRRGPDWIADETGVPARTVTRILRRQGLALLYELDSITGEKIRASKTTAVRYERARPG